MERWGCSIQGLLADRGPEAGWGGAACEEQGCGAAEGRGRGEPSRGCPVTAHAIIFHPANEKKCVLPSFMGRVFVICLASVPA